MKKTYWFVFQINRDYEVFETIIMRETPRYLIREDGERIEKDKVEIFTDEISLYEYLNKQMCKQLEEYRIALKTVDKTSIDGKHLNGKWRIKLSLPNTFNSPADQQPS